MSIGSRLAWKHCVVAVLATLLVLVVAGCSSTQQQPESAAPAEANVQALVDAYRSFGGEVLTIDAGTPTVSANVSTVGTMAAATATQGNPPCAGFIETVPSMVFKLEMAATALDIAFDGATNSTIILLDQEGQIYCDENAPLTAKPTYTLSAPTAKEYAVYIGRTDMQQPASGTLTVTAQP